MLPPDDVYRGRASEGEVEILSEPTEVDQALDAARRQLRAQELPEEWADTGKVFEDEYVTLYRDPVRFPGGKLGTYLRISWSEKLGNGVVILPKLNNSFVLTRHFRHATRAWHWEIPRGFGERNASSIQNATRELMEEIGVEPLSLKFLGVIYPDAGMTGHKADVYLADIARIGKVDRREGISHAVVRRPHELLDMIAKGDISDGVTLSAVGLALAQGYLFDSKGVPLDA
jgi:ADP-ribose pyrophosphatase